MWEEDEWDGLEIAIPAVVACVVGWVGPTHPHFSMVYEFSRMPHTILRVSDFSSEDS